MKRTGGNINKNDRADLIGDVILNTSTAVTIIAENENRIGLIVSNPTNRDVWLQFKNGSSTFSNSVRLLRGDKYEMADNIYSGEIKGIADIGTPTVTVVEY